MRESALPPPEELRVAKRAARSTASMSPHHRLFQLLAQSTSSHECHTGSVYRYCLAALTGSQAADE